MPSYVHCPTCRCAFDLERGRCPRCPDPAEIKAPFDQRAMAAIDKLATLLADASDDQIDTLRQRLDQRLLGVLGTGEAAPDDWRAALLGATRKAVHGAPSRLTGHARAMLTDGWSRVASRQMPRVAKRLRRATERGLEQAAGLARRATAMWEAWSARG